MIIEIHARFKSVNAHVRGFKVACEAKVQGVSHDKNDIDALKRVQVELSRIEDRAR